MSPVAALRSVKVLHTVVWVLFVGCILAIPVLGWLHRFGPAVVLVGIVLIEVPVLALNRMRCPLTALAGRYTTDRRDNFDIYLPLWLARYNKEVFGTLFVVGSLFTFARWLTR